MCQASCLDQRSVPELVAWRPKTENPRSQTSAAAALVPSTMGETFSFLHAIQGSIQTKSHFLSGLAKNKKSPNFSFATEMVTRKVTKVHELREVRILVKHEASKLTEGAEELRLGVPLPLNC